MNIVLLLITLFLAAFPATSQADIASTISKIKPSVVIIGTYSSLSSPRFVLRGTGFVVGDGLARNSNLVITNAHVLQQAAEDDSLAALAIQVRSDHNELMLRSATVFAVDKVHDLALLRFEGSGVPPLSLGDSGLVREGQSLAFMGFPIGGVLGFSPVTHRGMVSSITTVALPMASAQQLNSQVIRSLRGNGNFDIFQLDGTAYPGNSGGPLFDPDTGQVFGVVNMVFIKGTRESALTHPSGISYAIPSGFIIQLLESGKTKLP
jgi:serine protease Do